MQLIVLPTGSVRCLYSEVIDLASLGSLSIERASHVEPDRAGEWTADLGPVGGPTLGPFALRSAAIEAERDWLERRLLAGASDPIA